MKGCELDSQDVHDGIECHKYLHGRHRRGSELECNVRLQESHQQMHQFLRFWAEKSVVSM